SRRLAVSSKFLTVRRAAFSRRGSCCRSPRMKDSAKKIVVIDDERPILMTLEALLKRHGYDFESANTAAAGVELLDRANADVLLTGESGVGKEVVANQIHRLSKRASGPMVKLNCAAFPQNMIEAELFGYVKGAFTGAVNDFPGMIHEATDGTLFLDEIADM